MAIRDVDDRFSLRMKCGAKHVQFGYNNWSICHFVVFYTESFVRGTGLGRAVSLLLWISNYL